MAESSPEPWNGFPLIIDSRTEPAPTSSDSAICTIGYRGASREAGEGHHRLRVLAPVDETAGPRSCDWCIGEACRRYIGCEIGTAMAERARARLSQLPSGIGRAS